MKSLLTVLFACAAVLLFSGCKATVVQLQEEDQDQVEETGEELPPDDVADDDLVDLLEEDQPIEEDLPVDVVDDDPVDSLEEDQPIEEDLPVDVVDDDPVDLLEEDQPSEEDLPVDVPDDDPVDLLEEDLPIDEDLPVEVPDDDPVDLLEEDLPIEEDLPVEVPDDDPVDLLEEDLPIEEDLPVDVPDDDPVDLLEEDQPSEEDLPVDVPDDDPVDELEQEEEAVVCTMPEVVENCHDGWCRIPAGCFIMGSPDGVHCPPDVPDCDLTDYPAEPGRNADEVQHVVTITRDYMIREWETTQAEFETFMGYNPSYFGPHGDGEPCGTTCPVETVNWHEALGYANAASRYDLLPQCYVCSGTGRDVVCGLDARYLKPQDCLGYRLPTEAEWEYAYRAGVRTAFYNGDIVSSGVNACEIDANLDSISWYCENGDDTTHPTALKSRNGWGLYDMAGNGWEWVWDWYYSYTVEPARDPDGPNSGERRVFRGGSYYWYPRHHRAAFRNYYSPGERHRAVTFRLVRTLP